MSDYLSVEPAVVRLADISLHKKIAQFERDTELPPLGQPSGELPADLLKIWLVANPVLVVRKRSRRETHYYCIGRVHVWRTARRLLWSGRAEFPVQIVSKLPDEDMLHAFYVMEMVYGHALYGLPADDVRSLWPWLNHPKSPENLNKFCSKMAFGRAMRTNMRGNSQ